MKYFQIKNFEKYQHYHTRSITSWVKIYFSIFDDYDFTLLNWEQKYCYIALIILAAKINNHIPNDVKYLSEKLGNNENIKENVSKLIEYRFLVECLDSLDSQSQIREDKIRIDKNREDKKEEDIVPNSETDSIPEPEVKPLLVFPCRGGKAKEWGLYETKAAEYHESFPAVDILQECRNARQWCIDNPAKQKTYNGMPSFLSRWLAREQNKPKIGGQNNGRHEKKRNAIDYEPSKYDGIEVK